MRFAISIAAHVRAPHASTDAAPVRFARARRAYVRLRARRLVKTGPRNERPRDRKPGTRENGR